MKRLKQSEVKSYRENMLLMEQSECCALCGKQITKRATLDHAHRGIHKDKIRGVLHDFCNRFLGKAENLLMRTCQPDSVMKDISPKIYDYITADYSKADWHPAKRKSEVIAFKNEFAANQKRILKGMALKQDNYDELDDSTAKKRVAHFKRLNAKT